MIDPDADQDRRPGLTKWERAADAIDRAEWALLEALDAGDPEGVREAEDRLAQCQRRAGRLRPAAGSALTRDTNTPASGTTDQRVATLERAIVPAARRNDRLRPRFDDWL